MNTIVIDTSAIIAVIANEPKRDVLIECTQGADLIAPLSVPWEIGNALSAMFKRGRISLTQALDFLSAYDKIPIRLVAVELNESVKIAFDLGIYAYDAYLIQTALKYRAPLLTLDGALIEHAEKADVNVIEVNV